MMKHISDSAILSNGVKMPWLGLGVYKAIEGEEVENAVKTAINIGYRSIDTAAFYKNEIGVGKAVKESGIPREEIFITTKVWNDRQGYESTLEAFEDSRRKLNLEYIDLYLIHWPVKDKFKDTWRALEKLYRDGYIKAIGVSNFQIHHLKDLMADSEIIPMVNQVEYHPQLPQKELHKFCNENNIQIEAWSPLMRGKMFEDPIVSEIGKKHNKTPAQIFLSWDLQNEVVTIPKTVHKNRMVENANIFDFELTADDMLKLDEMNQNKRMGPDPDNFDF